jgi:hypothetical protein
MSVTNKAIFEIGEVVVDAALDIFAECGAASDFCVQHIGGNIVFGGTNRLIWSSKFGFNPDRSYCTENFLKKWDERKCHGQG